MVVWSEFCGFSRFSVLVLVVSNGSACNDLGCVFV